MVWVYYKMLWLTKSNKKSTNAKKRGILRLLSAPARYIKLKIKSAYKKLVKKQPKKLHNEELYYIMKYIMKKYWKESQ